MKYRKEGKEMKRYGKKICMGLFITLVVSILFGVSISSANESMILDTQENSLHCATMDTEHIGTNYNYDKTGGNDNMTGYTDDETQKESTSDSSHDDSLTTNNKDKHTETINEINGNHNNITIYINNVSKHESSEAVKDHSQLDHSHDHTTTTHTIHPERITITTHNHIWVKIVNLLKSAGHIFDFIKYLLGYI